NTLTQLQNNEIELNRWFINMYSLQNELSPEVALDKITILKEELKIGTGKPFIEPSAVIRRLLSYSIGCMFGRYSLNKQGLILANQAETLQDFLKQVPAPTFMPDEDNIIPALDGEWFTDDIVGRFKVFLKTAFGEEHFEENLKYIEDTIGKDIRKYFVKDFYNDHIKRYKKRPIYWMFSSPKGHFKVLIYMHRYQSDLCSKLLNDYLLAYISKQEAAKQTQTMFSLREDISAREKNAALNEIDKLELMLRDCRQYEKTLFTIATQKISIDLDDGVKVNYQKFKEVLVPIKGLEKEEE
ncbi:MAG: class I SAM-dependent DNA methyltransferase, partial [Bacteroidota bacterium]